MLGVDAGFVRQAVLPGTNSHDNFFHGSVSCPFAYAVYGALHLPGPFPDCREHVGRGKSQIIVTVDAQDGLVDIGGVFHDITDHAAEIPWYGISHRVREVHRCGAGIDDPFKDPAQEVKICTAGILCGEFNIGSKTGCVFYSLAGHFQYLLPGFPELVLEMNVRGGKKGMYPGMGTLPDGFPCRVYVPFCSPGKGCHLDISEF